MEQVPGNFAEVVTTWEQEGLHYLLPTILQQHQALSVPEI
jgi:hypothetical protein